MKTTFRKMGLIAGMLLISAVTFAEGGKGKSSETSEYLDVQVFPLQDKMVRMSFHKLQDEKVRINVYDQYGERLHNEIVKDKTVVLKKFDMTNVPAGDYSFEVYNDVYSMKKTIEVK